MKLTKDQVRHIAKLARLELSDAEVSKFQTQLSGILEYVEKLNAVDTKNVQPTGQVTGLSNATRADVVLPSNYEEGLAAPHELLEESPLPIEDHQIKVKNVF